MFIAGEKDWSMYHEPRSLEAMKLGLSCADYRGRTVAVEGAGHWVQQEKPEEIVEEILNLGLKMRRESKMRWEFKMRWTLKAK